MADSAFSLDPELESEVADEPRFRTTNLTDRGRLQFFYHSPRSKLPVRDVTNEQGKGHKTEPYIEKQAENYCNACYQGNNIIPFLKSSERYLFLFTTCRNPDLDENGSRYIVGYIEKDRALRVGSHYAVQGPVSLYRFQDAFPLHRIHENPMDVRTLKVNGHQTNQIIRHFNREEVEDVFPECLDEVERLKKDGGAAAVPPPERDQLEDSSEGNDSGC